MAVPKSKKSKSKTRMRRAHLKLKPVMYTFNKTTGEITLPHRVSLDGYYKDRQIICKNKNKQNEDNSDNNTVQ